MTAKKGDWVQIYFVALTPAERASHLPEDTKKVPLEVRIKGFLENECAEIGDNVTVKTFSGRTVSGNLVDILPSYKHNFGAPVQELLNMHENLWNILTEGEKNE
ncbi:MAG TPA: 2-amino-4-oxopentanoate thiolase subunit OrtA [Tepiditoga sp.]|nr:2-amino-4-ketopentanoate thiolase [Thermotogota bacterium]HOO73696.1 2-amino-4-oxopentanoate thiolase subunit OrtA [Tepiditoga sp.]